MPITIYFLVGNLGITQPLSDWLGGMFVTAFSRRPPTVVQHLLRPSARWHPLASLSKLLNQMSSLMSPQMPTNIVSAQNPKKRITNDYSTNHSGLAESCEGCP